MGTAGDGRGWKKGIFADFLAEFWESLAKVVQVVDLISNTKVAVGTCRHRQYRRRCVTVPREKLLIELVLELGPILCCEKKVVIFGLPGAFTGVCTSQHVPSFAKHAEQFKSKGVDSIICVAVNDPYVMNGWAEKLQCKDKLEFYGDFDGKFHKSIQLDLDLSSALLGPRSHRWAAYVEDGIIKHLNVEKVPSEFKVSDAKTLYDQMNVK
ncbi:hypothetical protein L7F22_035696 [Adiantum nelumboides]|nr:hypothetical protein [Adiantum nelumboides]